MNTIFWIISDIWVMTERNIVQYLRLPRLLVFSTIQPLMFLLLFVYVFGGAINVPGSNYMNFLVPGILIQTVLFGSIQTGVGLADDLSHGMIDRFRTLPMARSAVLAGRTISDMLRNIFVVFLMTGAALLIGFRFQGDFSAALGAIVLAILFGFSFSWISATIGLSVKNPEATQVASFIWVFPLAFTSSIFVPIETMPKILEFIARYSPITITVNAARALALNQPASEWVWKSLLWIAGILVVFVPLSVSLYRKQDR